MFLLTFLVVNMADTKRKMENDVFAAAGIAQKYNCALTRLDYQQEAGLMSSVPLGENLVPIQRGLTTSSTAIFIPFITQELFQTGEALYYGLNALSNNMILCDRKQLKNPNGLILGTPGSGKSFAAKREMTNAFLITDDDIIICDPEAEYFSLVQRLNGQVVRLSPAGKGMDGKPQYVNPFICASKIFNSLVSSNVFFATIPSPYFLSLYHLPSPKYSVFYEFVTSSGFVVITR